MFLYLLENTHNQWTESFQYSNASFIEKKLIVPSDILFGQNLKCKHL
jgi:hypothetical protein